MSNNNLHPVFQRIVRNILETVPPSVAALGEQKPPASERPETPTDRPERAEALLDPVLGLLQLGPEKERLIRKLLRAAYYEGRFDGIRANLRNTKRA